MGRCPHCVFHAYFLGRWLLHGARPRARRGKHCHKERYDSVTTRSVTDRQGTLDQHIRDRHPRRPWPVLASVCTHASPPSGFLQDGGLPGDTRTLSRLLDCVVAKRLPSLSGTSSLLRLLGPLVGSGLPAPMLPEAVDPRVMVVWYISLDHHHRVMSDPKECLYLLRRLVIVNAETGQDELWLKENV